MNPIIVASGGALWLGILTSISPCPLTTNIAAATYIGRSIGKSREIILSGLLYTLGRVLTYSVLGILLVTGLSSARQISGIVDGIANKLLGPILIVVGMFLLELVSLPFSTEAPGGEALQEKAKSRGIWGAMILGILFALSFCPISAALFFGSLIPLALQHSSRVLLPVLYGVGTGLPVLVFSYIAAFSAQKMAQAFNKMQQFQLWARWITGGVFILAGIYYTVIYIFMK